MTKLQKVFKFKKYTCHYSATLSTFQKVYLKKQLTESKILLTSTCIISGSDFASWGKLSSKQQE